MNTTFALPGHSSALAALAASFVDLARSAASAEPAAGGQDFVLWEDLTEHVDLDYRFANPPVHGPGDWDTYDSTFVTADGEHVGSLKGTGRILYERSADAHLMMYYREEITFPDGTAQTAGWVDGTAILGGAWQRFPIVGTGGRYEGMIGLRSFQPSREAPHSRYHSHLVLREVGGGFRPSTAEELDSVLSLLGAFVGPAVNPPTASGRLEPPVGSGRAVPQGA
ncbi:allene oxide cyclase barrel-like domain-containing protein [Streptomyces sp. NPDC002640]